jgi:hypothetical protein
MATEDQEDLIIAPVPALVAVLLHLEKSKGAPLTEQEVLHARDHAECIAMPPHAHAAVVEARGYDDIDPERAWEEWLAIRPSLYEGEA